MLMLKHYVSPFFLLYFFNIVAFGQTTSPEEILAAMNIHLSTPGKPIANYIPAVRSGNLLFLSGAGPKSNDGKYITGKVGGGATIEEAYAAARLTAIRHLEILKTELGDLNRIKRVVKVLGMVNCTPEFEQHPAAINGYSDLMAEVFGENGKHARSAIGVCSLPFNMLLEVETIVEIKDED